LLLALLLAACGSTAPSPPPASPSAAVLPTLSPSPVAPTPVATPSPLPTIATPALPTPGATGEDTPAPVPHDDPSLEALLPVEIRGTILLRESARVERNLTDDESSLMLAEFIESQGRTPADLIVASAYSDDITFGLYLAAFRGEGIDPIALRDVLIRISELGGPIDQTAKDVGGKRVLHVTDTQHGLSSYIYVTQGVLFLVETLDPTMAEEALQKLP
jgi:hypothetical protein